MPLPVIFKFLTDMSGARFDDVSSGLEDIHVSSGKASRAIKDLASIIRSGEEPVTAMADGFSHLAKAFGIGAGASLAIVGVVEVVKSMVAENEKLNKITDELNKTFEDFQSKAGGLDFGESISQIEKLNKALAESQKQAGEQKGVLGRAGETIADLFAGTAKTRLDTAQTNIKSAQKQAKFAAETAIQRELEFETLKRKSPLDAEGVKLGEKHKKELKQAVDLGLSEVAINDLKAKQKLEMMDLVRKDNQIELENIQKQADERARIRKEEEAAFEQKQKRERAEAEWQKSMQEQIADIQARRLEEGKQASGTLLDKIRGAAERLGMTGIMGQIDVARKAQQRQTDVELLGRAGIEPGRLQSLRPNEMISQLAQTEGQAQREQNDKLFNAFENMHQVVADILQKIDERLGIPILRSAS